MIRLPPKVIAATVLVAVFPVLAVWGLEAAGVVSSVIASSALGAALSIGFYQLAAVCWERQADSGDVLFGDLMLWGWIGRRRQERRLADAVKLLGRGDPLSLEKRRRAAILERLASDLETRDPYTHGHSRRVARYSSLIAKRMGLPHDEVTRIRTAAAVHDVGKLGIPRAILHKPGRLTEAEFAQVMQHPADGAEMVSMLEDEELTAIVRHHHERLDGAGYPDRLRGDQIPLGARIIAVADTFDAITSARSYRTAKPHKAALDILAAEAGTQLDGGAVGAFRSVYLARRPVSAWIALTDATERLLAWLAGDAIGSSARLAAVAAGTIAVGGGLSWQAAFAGGSRLRASPPTHAAQAARLSACCKSLSSYHALVPVPATHAAAGVGTGLAATHGSSTGLVSSKPGSGASAGAIGHSGGPGSGAVGGGSAPGPQSSGGGPVGHHVGVAVGTGTGSAGPTVGASVGSGSSGVGLHVGGGQSSPVPNVGATVTVPHGGPSVSVSTGGGSGLHPKLTLTH